MNVGDVVYLLPIGNNARYGKVELRKTFVSKVGRKYFVVGEGYPTVKFHLEDKRQVTDYAADWALYFSEQEYLDKKEKELLELEIRDVFGSYGSTGLTLDQLRKIKEVITPTLNT